MGSVPEEDRLELVQEAFEAWQKLLSGAYPRLGGKPLEQIEDETLIEPLIRYVAKAIEAAVREDRVARAFCHLWYYIHHFPDGSAEDYVEVRGDLTAIYEGIRVAGRTFAENRDKPIDEHVKECVAAELARLRDRRIDEARKKNPEELLPDVLNWPRLNAAVLLEHLTFEQRNGLLDLLGARTGRKSLRMQLRDEPEDELLWRIWYTIVQQVIEPAVRERLEGKDRLVIVLLGEGWGKPLPEGKSAAAPQHASFYLQLAKELKNRGYPIKRPESRRRIARLTGKSRSTIDRYLEEVEVKLIVEGGRWRVHLTAQDIKRSLDAARGEKRGPKNDA
jgi:hypothetical protein